MRDIATYLTHKNEDVGRLHEEKWKTVRLAGPYPRNFDASCLEVRLNPEEVVPATAVLPEPARGIRPTENDHRRTGELRYFKKPMWVSKKKTSTTKVKRT